MRGAVVTLGDLAQILAADPQQTAQLAAIELFAAPAASGQRLVRLRELQDLLVLRGFDLASHRFSGSSEVLITGDADSTGQQAVRPVTDVAQQRAERRVRDALVKYLHENASVGAAWTVEFHLSEPQVRTIASTAHSPAIVGGRPPWTGLQRFAVTIATDQGPVEFLLDADVSLPPAVVATVRSVPKGALIRTADVTLRSATADEASAAGFLAAEEVVGKETTRAIPEGKVVEASWIRSPLLVRRGDVVTVAARTAGVVVRTTARARDDGSFGDLVAVESLTDRTTYFARVEAVREVTVYARAPRVAGAPTANSRWR